MLPGSQKGEETTSQFLPSVSQFQFLHRSASPIIICCSLYFLERALSLLFFSDSLRRSLRTALVQDTRVCVPPCLFTLAVDRVTHNFGKIPQRCSVVLGIVPNSVFFPKNNADNSGYLRCRRSLLVDNSRKASNLHRGRLRSNM